MAVDPFVWDEGQFDDALARVASSEPIDARGVCLGTERLRRLLDAIPKDPHHAGRKLAFSANFSGTTFSDDVDFSEVRFSREARFDSATFTCDATFRGATFAGHARFDRTAFGGIVRFDDSSITGDAWFDDATFCGEAWFNNAEFAGDATFVGATFREAVQFAPATFRRGARFDGVAFCDAAHFDEARFSARTVFDEAAFGRNAHFDRASFEQARALGPIFVAGTLDLRGAVFGQMIRIQVSSRRVLLDGATFRAGIDVLARWAEISLEDADFAAPSLVTHLIVTPNPGDRRPFLGEEAPLTEGGWSCSLSEEDAPVKRKAAHPRVVSVRRAKVAGLTLSSVDLRACHFAGSHALDGLRLEHTRLARPPTGWQRRLRHGWWTRRQTIAEEHAWRRRNRHGDGWYQRDSAERAPQWLAQEAHLEPADIAGIYRALRKGQEDNKDEAGAADFYYGEMEMRRQRPSPSPDFGRPVTWAERQIIALYWVVAGYGLRASRALLALAVTVGLLAAGLDSCGFVNDKDYWQALLFAFESSVSLLRAPKYKLTPGGEVILIALRLAGPLFFGLALLSLRGRVKR